MTLITAADATRFTLQGNEFIGFASPNRGARETAVWRVTIPAGKVSPGPHQLTREEILVALSGTASCRIGDVRHAFAAGDVVIVPAFTDFELDNPGDAPFEAMAVLPIGGRAMLPDTAPFTPPWAE